MAYLFRLPYRAIILYIFYSPKTAANTKATKKKGENVQITTIPGFR